MRMPYCDDSGAENTGLIVYGWVECDVQDWGTGYQELLELRAALYAQHSIPPDRELHATEYVNGRGRLAPSRTDLEGADLKVFGQAVAEEILTSIASSTVLRVGAVYRRTSARRSDYHREKIDLYRRLTAEWNNRDDYTLVHMDGEEPAYRQVHRDLALPQRKVIEDPIYLDSKQSQWVQAADLVAYAAYMHLLHAPGREFAWDWYPDYLAASDPAGAPQEM